ncbi:MAG: OmpA family protein [Actinomycetota bacterium]
MKLPFGSRRPRPDDVDLDIDDFDEHDAFDQVVDDGYLDGIGDPATTGERPVVPRPAHRTNGEGERPIGRPRPQRLGGADPDDPSRFNTPSVEDVPGVLDDPDQGRPASAPAPAPEGRRGRLPRRGAPPPRHQGYVDDGLDDGLDDGSGAPDPRAPSGVAAVAAEEFAEEMERLRSEASAEQRTAWAYLGVLTGMFSLLVVFGYGCSDQGRSEVATGEAVEMAETGQPSQLVFRVEGDIITVQGTVPNDASRTQLLTLAQNAYGAANVIDEITVDPGFSFDAGTIRSVGSARFEDERPQALHDMIAADFGLADRGFEVGFVETVLTPVNAQAELNEDLITLSGTLPDQQSIEDLVALSSEIWGASNVDATRLSIGDTTWTEGRIRLTGRTVSTDLRIQDFGTGVAERIGQLVTVDTAGLVVDDITLLLADINNQIITLLEAEPIQFEPLSAEIDPGSDTVLTQLAQLLAEVPSSDFEVVGHTDDVGDDQENLLLSQERAQAVVDRLGELGIAVERMTSRGEGEAQPIADNDTDEGRAANRRIEFVFVGVTLPEETPGSETTDSTTADGETTPEAGETTSTTAG